MNIAFIIDLAVVLALVAGMSLVSGILGPRRTLKGQKGLPYETGMPPFGPPLGRSSFSYQRLAVLFVVFDADLAFLVPWVLLRDQLSFEALVSLTVFILLAGLTLAYLWRKGGLECR
ncbi:MAG: NADH-quinone oxidoreductase subunit A [Elusimicrobiota bacterium]|jgi:NADH-quinone oxidoreductase subunit A